MSEKHLYPWTVKMEDESTKMRVVYAEDNIKAGQTVLMRFCPPNDIRIFKTLVRVGPPMEGDLLEIREDQCIPFDISPLFSIAEVVKRV